MRIKTFLLAASLISAVSALPTTAKAADQDFVLVNRTGYEIDEVYVSRTQASSWQSDVLGDGVLNTDRQKHIRFNAGSRGCMFDIKVVYEDKDEAEWHNINLCEVSKVTVHYNRRSGETSAETE